MEQQYFALGDVFAYCYDDASDRWSRQGRGYIDPETHKANDLKNVVMSVKHPHWEHVVIFVECKGRQRQWDQTYAYRATRHVEAGYQDGVERLI